ncbi:MAG: hypothetical protein ABIH59_00900 [archaeon]
MVLMVFLKMVKRVNYCLMCKKQIEAGNLFCNKCREKDIFERLKVFIEHGRLKFDLKEK